tara:strand:- start:496 stop:1002 length:507 start_codon:yes stop_codon:yes gene_type:complete
MLKNIMNNFKTVAQCMGFDENQENAGVLRILRTYHGTKATTSEWIFPNDEEIVGLENPWLDNKQFDSCIPEGMYKVKKIPSDIVNRTTGGKIKQGYEITDAEGRTGIIFHIGNYVDDTDGCPLTGTTIGEFDGIPCVWESSKAFYKFMKLMDECDIEYVSIEKKEENE